MELKQTAEPSVCMMLLGNKLDECEENEQKREVKRSEAEILAKNYGMLFDEVSAFKDINVKKSFETLLESIFYSKMK